MGNFFTSLKLVDAFKEYDAVFALSRRKYIPPNFAELRHVVNIAQVGTQIENAKSAGSQATSQYADSKRTQRTAYVPCTVGLLSRQHSCMCVWVRVHRFTPAQMP